MTEFVVGATHTNRLLIESTVFASKMNEEESEIVMSSSNIRNRRLQLYHMTAFVIIILSSPNKVL